MYSKRRDNLKGYSGNRQISRSLEERAEAIARFPLLSPYKVRIVIDD
jgi:hypothetical protein